MNPPQAQESVLDYLLKNQTVLVQKVGDLEKSSAVIAVEMRMMRELLEKQAAQEDRLRAVERWMDEQKGKSSVHVYIGSAIVSVIVGVIVAFIKQGIP